MSGFYHSSSTSFLPQSILPLFSLYFLLSSYHLFLPFTFFLVNTSASSLSLSLSLLFLPFFYQPFFLLPSYFTFFPFSHLSSHLPFLLVSPSNSSSSSSLLPPLSNPHHSDPPYPSISFPFLWPFTLSLSLPFFHPFQVLCFPLLFSISSYSSSSSSSSDTNKRYCLESSLWSNYQLIWVSYALNMLSFL